MIPDPATPKCTVLFFLQTATMPWPTPLQRKGIVLCRFENITLIVRVGQTFQSQMVQPVDGFCNPVEIMRQQGLISKTKNPHSGRTTVNLNMVIQNMSAWTHLNAFHLFPATCKEKNSLAISFSILSSSYMVSYTCTYLIRCFGFDGGNNILFYHSIKAPIPR